MVAEYSSLPLFIVTNLVKIHFFVSVFIFPLTANLQCYNDEIYSESISNVFDFMLKKY